MNYLSNAYNKAYEAKQNLELSYYQYMYPEHDPLKELVYDAVKLIFSHLNLSELGKVHSVSKIWNKLASDPELYSKFLITLPKLEQTLESSNVFKKLEMSLIKEDIQTSVKQYILKMQIEKMKREQKNSLCK